METNELRIGNYVMDGLGDFAYQKIRSIQPQHSNEVTIDYNGVDVLDRKLSEIKPIELTEDWLIRFGFKYRSNSSDGSAMHKGGVYLGVLSDCYCFNAESSSNKSRRLTFVHELQNLYHALTGEELEII